MSVDGDGGGGPRIVGVDVGGTKVAAAQLSGTRIEHAVELPTHHTTAAAVVDDIGRAIGSVVEHCGTPDAIGIGIPSQVEAASRTVVSSVNIPLAGVQLGPELESRLGVPVFVDNDGNCAALAEAELADGGPCGYLVMYTLGTGVGGGVVIDGRIYRGATGLGAELGHVTVQADGPPCPGACPNRGCLEALCSGTALMRDARALAEAKPETRLGRLAAGGKDVTGRDVEDAAADGDPEALALLERLGVWLGVGLAGAINTFEPERIVIGGGLSRAARFFLEPARREAKGRALPALAERVDISLARAGAEAGVIGAALLATHELAASATAGQEQR